MQPGKPSSNIHLFFPSGYPFINSCDHLRASACLLRSLTRYASILLIFWFFPFFFEFCGLCVTYNSIEFPSSDEVKLEHNHLAIGTRLESGSRWHTACLSRINVLYNCINIFFSSSLISSIAWSPQTPALEDLSAGSRDGQRRPWYPGRRAISSGHPARPRPA